MITPGIPGYSRFDCAVAYVVATMFRHAHFALWMLTGIAFALMALVCLIDWRLAQMIVGEVLR